MKDLIYSIDFGTQSVRTMLVDPKGNIVDLVKVNIEPYYSTKPGWAEQDVNYMWKSFCEAANILKEKSGKNFERIAGVCVTTQSGTVINLDKNGEALRPAIIWMDNRKTWGLPKYNGPDRILHKLVKMDLFLDLAQADGEVNWIMKHQPEIWDKTHKFVMLSGYLVYKLTGEHKDSAGGIIAYLPYDFKKFSWAGKSNVNSFIFPIEHERLSELVPPTEIMGEITGIASKETGIPEGTPVIASGTDKGCEAVGVGCISPEHVSLSFGTSAIAQVLINKYVEAVTFVPPYPSPIPNVWNPQFQIYRGFWMVEWFKQEFGEKEVNKAIEDGTIPEEELNKLLHDVPAGSMGLTLQPYWTSSPKIPGPEGKGSIIGFGDVHKKSHLYKAIIEGLGYGLRQGTDTIQKKTGVKIIEARVAGGGSQSDSVCQIISDIFNLPVKRSSVFESTGIGNAIVGMIGMNLHKDFDSAVKDMVKLSYTFEPDAKNSKIYQNLYKRVYLKMYKRIKPLLKEIQSIINYPYYGD